MKPALTLKNILILLTCVPLRALLLLPLWGLVFLGQIADMAYEWVNANIPGLEPDKVWDRKRLQKQHSELVQGYKGDTDAKNYRNKSP